MREYTVGDRAALDSYPVDAICDGAHGAPLIPWPNRLADGRYSFDGVDYQLALSEPDKRTAIHGLLRWRNWRVAERDADRVRVGTRLHPLPGWPFALDVSITYSLGEAGLTVETHATNVGAVRVPVRRRPAPVPVGGRRAGRRLHGRAARRRADRHRRRPRAADRVGAGRRDVV